MVLMPRSASVTLFRLNVKPNFAVCLPFVQLTSSLNWYWVTLLPSGHAEPSKSRALKDPSPKFSEYGKVEASTLGFELVKIAAYQEAAKMNWLITLGEKVCVSSSWPS